MASRPVAASEHRRSADYTQRSLMHKQGVRFTRRGRRIATHAAAVICDTLHPLIIEMASGAARASA